MKQYKTSLNSRDFYDDSSLSRKNSYCSHGSRWSYSSHADPMLLLYRSASRSGGRYFDNKAAATDFYKAAEYYDNKAAVEFDSKVVTEELNVAVVEKEVEAAAAAASVVVNGSGNDGVMFSDEFMMPPDYLVSYQCNQSPYDPEESRFWTGLLAGSIISNIIITSHYFIFLKCNLHGMILTFIDRYSS